jgi:hypothetical protein
MQLQSTLICPRCAHQVTEAMPTDACQFFYDCKGCGARLTLQLSFFEVGPLGGGLVSSAPE